MSDADKKPGHGQQDSDGKGKSEADTDTKAQLKLAKAKANKLKVMLNPVVLTKLAGRLPSASTLNLRETCSEWNFSFIPEFRTKHTPIKLDLSIPENKEKSVAKFCEQMHSSSNIPFRSYHLVSCRQALQGFGSVCGSSVTKFQVEYFWDGKINWETSDLRHAIFVQMPHLRDLELKFIGPSVSDAVGNRPSSCDCTIKNLKQNQPTKSTSTSWSTQQKFAENKNLPNLTRFSFQLDFADGKYSQCEELNTRVIDQSIDVVSNIIQCATGLKKLAFPGPDLSNPPNSNYYDLKNYYELLAKLLGEVRDLNTHIHKLKELHIGEANQRILQILLEMAQQKEKNKRLVLNGFSTSKGWPGPTVDLEGATEDQEEDLVKHRALAKLLQDFLATQASSLLQLTIWLDNAPSYYPIPIFLPRLEQLKFLKIIDVKRLYDPLDIWPYDCDLRFDGHTLADTLPALKYFNYFFNEFGEVPADREVELERHGRIGQHPGVTNLSLAVVVYDDTAPMFVFPTRFVGVTCLELSVEVQEEVDDGLVHIWTMCANSLPALTKLKLYVEVYSGDRVDEMLTGVARGAIQDARAELDALVLAGQQLTLDTLGSLASRYKTAGGISDLSTRLQEFELKWNKAVLSSKNNVPAELTAVSDISVYLGLALVGPQLQRITIQLHNSSTRFSISNTCLQFWRSVLDPLAEINLTHRFPAYALSVD